MGSSSSKPARKLGQEATSQILRQGQTASRPSPPPAPPAAPAARDGGQEATAQPHSPQYAPPARQAASGFSEAKTQAVQNDGRDPQLLANLQKLGQVKVPRGKVRFQQSNPMLNILAARQKNTAMEEDATTAAQVSSAGVSNTGSLKNRMNASTIVMLLDERKQCKTRQEVQRLAVAYDTDLATVERMARWVNSPSVESGAHLPKVHRSVEDGDDTPERVNAVWTEPALSDVRSLPPTQA